MPYYVKYFADESLQPSRKQIYPYLAGLGTLSEEELGVLHMALSKLGNV